MANITVMDAWAKDKIEDALKEAQTIEDIKAVIKLLLDELPIDHY